MNITDQINAYLASQPEPKRSEMLQIHERTLEAFPDCQLWFSDGTNSEGKVVSNPNIGYGCYTIRYADGSTKEFFQVGLSANTSGISVYIMGLADKTLLNTKFGSTLGKASITGYCIKFKSLKDIDVSVLQDAIRFGLTESRE